MPTEVEKSPKRNKPQKTHKVLKFGLIFVSIILIIAVASYVYTYVQNTLLTGKESSQVEVYTVAPQEPYLLEGMVDTQVNETYSIDPTKGKIVEVYVQDKESVSEGQALFRYENEVLLEEIADIKRQQKRLYNQREEAYQELSQQKQKREQAKQNPSTTESSGAEVVDLTVFDESIKASEKAIQELTQAIEDVEIKLARLSSKTEEIVKADKAGVVTLNQAGKTNPTEPFIQLTGSSRMIQSSITEYDYEMVHEKQAVSVYVNAQGRTIDGVIESVGTQPQKAASFGRGEGPSVGSSVSRYVVQVKPSEDLPLGFNVQVSIPVSGLVIPENTIVMDGEQEFVWLYEEGKVKKTLIKRQKQGLQQQVIEGLKEGDKIIISPAKDLNDGSSITIKEG